MTCQNSGDLKHSLLCCNLLCFGPSGLKNAAPAAAFVILTARQRDSDNPSIRRLDVNHQYPEWATIFTTICSLMRV